MSHTIRAVEPGDADAVWTILEPMIRAGETYPLPRDMDRSAALAYWFGPTHRTFVAEVSGEVAGTYYFRPNNQGGGGHVANCGYVVGQGSEGKGIARAMCAHSIDLARQEGYRAIQFNFVVASNGRAVRLWTSMGFETLAVLPGVFEHPKLGFVDALVMFMALD